MVEVFTPDEWECRKGEQTQEKASTDDFWTRLEQRRAQYDPSKTIDWTRYGYARGKDGRWHASSSAYWEDNGYRRVRGRWQSLEEAGA